MGHDGLPPDEIPKWTPRESTTTWSLPHHTFGGITVRQGIGADDGWRDRQYAGRSQTFLALAYPEWNHDRGSGLAGAVSSSHTRAWQASEIPPIECVGRPNSHTLLGAHSGVCDLSTRRPKNGLAKWLGLLSRHEVLSTALYCISFSASQFDGIYVMTICAVLLHNSCDALLCYQRTIMSRRNRMCTRP